MLLLTRAFCVTVFCVIDNAVQVTIMRKEKLILEFESRQVRDRVMAEFLECIEFATASKFS